LLAISSKHPLEDGKTLEVKQTWLLEYDSWRMISSLKMKVGHREHQEKVGKHHDEWHEDKQKHQLRLALGFLRFSDGVHLTTKFWHPHELLANPNKPLPTSPWQGRSRQDRFSFDESLDSALSLET
jgi:hypothetical protein